MVINKDNIINILDSYFCDELSLEEQKEVRDAISNDPDLKEQAMLFAKMVRKARMRQSSYEQSLYSRKAFSSWKWIVGMAAVVLVLFGVNIFGKSYMSNQIFKNCYSAYIPYSDVRGENPITIEEEKLFKTFNEIGVKNDSEIISKLEEYKEKAKDDYCLSLYDVDIHWYLALAYVKSHRFKAAISECDYVISKYPDSTYIPIALSLKKKIKGIPFL